MALITNCTHSVKKGDVIERHHCFRKETPFKDVPEKKDIEELQLTISGNKVTGTFNWLPALKDQRKGNVEGELNDSTITAKYMFSQEGARDTVAIRIVLMKERAVISGGDSALGLNSTLPKIDCKN